MRRLNILSTAVDYDAADPAGYRGAMARFGPSIGATKIGGSVYELPPGQSICPYHYEHGDEEWLLVLAGHPTVRHPGGEDRLEPGDVVCFPEGPGGAHKVTSAGEETVRVLMVSTVSYPAVAVYPDSGKIGVFTTGGADDVMVRRESSVEYYDGERPGDG